VLDSLVGVYITALYFLYFVVVKNTLAIFDCSPNAQGIITMDAEPSIVCDSTNPWYPTLYRWAVVFVAVYGFGIPALFFYMLFMHRHGIKRDQELRKYGDGSTAAKNPDIAIRRRYSKLYMVRSGAATGFVLLSTSWCAVVLPETRVRSWLTAGLQTSGHLLAHPPYRAKAADGHRDAVLQPESTVPGVALHSHVRACCGC
jgi:hypothetical protein